jgi:hypothetical protein
MLPPTVVVLQVLAIFAYPTGQDVLFVQTLARVVLLRHVMAAKASCTSEIANTANAKTETDLNMLTSR